MNNEQTKHTIKILMKRIRDTEKQISNLKPIGSELNTPNKIVSYNVLIRKEHKFLISQLNNGSIYIIIIKLRVLIKIYIYHLKIYNNVPPKYPRVLKHKSGDTRIP